MREFIDIVTEAMDSVVFHSTEFGLEILQDGMIKANTLIQPSEFSKRAADLRFDKDANGGTRGICVTRSFYFARQFSNVIFALKLDKIKHNHRILPRAEIDAYDLANDHGDFRLEAEEFIVCNGLPVEVFVAKIWLTSEYRDDPEYAPIVAHPLFAGFFNVP